MGFFIAWIYSLFTSVSIACPFGRQCLVSCSLYLYLVFCVPPLNGSLPSPHHFILPSYGSGASLVEPLSYNAEHIQYSLAYNLTLLSTWTFESVRHNGLMGLTVINNNVKPLSQPSPPTITCTTHSPGALHYWLPLMASQINSWFEF